MSVRVFEDGEERKLILANEGNPRGLLPEELYDVARDAHEARNLAATHGDDVRRLGRTVQDLARAAEVGAVERTGIDLSDSAVERMRSLGYAGGEGEHTPAPAPDAGGR